MPGSEQSGVSSQHSGSTAAAVDNILRPGGEDGQVEEKAFSHGVMGVMYTVCKEKGKPSIGFICFRLFVDWWQLWLLVVQPPTFDLPSHELWWRIFSFISLNQFMSIRGYQFFLACFYLLVAGLVLSVVLSVWVGIAFQRNRFDHVWPIVVLRWFAKVFYQMLDVMSLSLFLMALDCQLFYREPEVLGYNAEFPDVYCWTMPHLIHVFVAIIATVVFITMDCFFVVGEIEMDFTSHNDLAIMHTGVELQTFTIRVVMTIVSVLVYNPKWASVSQLIMSSYLTYLMWYWQPQVEGWVNHVRTGMYASVAWCSALYVILAFNLGWDAGIPEDSKDAIWFVTMIMWLTTIPVGMLGALASWLRLRHINTVVLGKFRRHVDTVVDAAVFVFSDSRFAEILARCCRAPSGKGSLQPNNVELAETVLLAGLAQLPKDPFMVILYSSFLMDVQSSYQSGYTQLQAAKKMDAGPLMRFAIFSREQQHAQRSAAGGLGNKQSDLVSYVEFQRNYGMALKVHRETLMNIQRFWEALMHRHVKFRTLTETVRAMDASIRSAESVYRQVLQRHATSVKIVKLYARFLEDVKQDPWAASRWFSEAERLEAVEEEVKHHDALGGLEIDDPALRAALLEAGPMSGAAGDGRAIVIINAQSIIQMTNQATHNLLGYSKSELKGKGLRMLLPACVADSHSTFVRNYIQSGQATAMKATAQQLVMHKDRRLLPVKLTVSKISGIGEDTLFMGVMEVVQRPANVASMWLTMEGSILTVCPTFEDWFGFPVRELQSQDFQNVVVQGVKTLEFGLRKARSVLTANREKDMMDRAALIKTPKRSSMPVLATDTRNSPASELESQTSSSAHLLVRSTHSEEEVDEWPVGGVQIAHKYSSPTEVDIQIRNAGVGTLRFQVLTIRKQRTAHRQSSSCSLYTASLSGSLAPGVSQDRMLVTNTKGQILHITSQLSEMLGRSKQPYATFSLDNLMVAPFGQLHRAVLQGMLPSAPPPYSCRSGLSVLLQGQGPRGQAEQQPFKLHIKRKVTPEETQFVVVLHETTVDQALDERRLMMELDEQGMVTSVCSESPPALFGIEADKLVGKHVGSFIDILRPANAPPSGELDPIQQQDALAVLLEMASPALDASSTCWRCGFIVPEAAPAGSESLAAAKVKGMLSGKAKPALMRLRVSVGTPEAPCIAIEMELWRADLVTSVIEVDNEGIIQPPDSLEMAELYPPDLLLGTCLEDMVDQHISGLVAPLANKKMSELFVPGAFGQMQQVVDAKRPLNKRSALKSTEVGSDTAGPVHLMRIPHHSDHGDLQISLQAVHKLGGSGGILLVLHSVKPICGRPDFCTWLLASAVDDKDAGNKPNLAKKASMRLQRTRSLLGQSSIVPARLLSPAKAPTSPVDAADNTAFIAGAATQAQLDPDDGSIDLGHHLSPRPSVRHHLSDSDPGTPNLKEQHRIATWVNDHSIPAADGETRAAAQASPFQAKHTGGINWAENKMIEPEPESHEVVDEVAVDIADEAAAQAEAVDESDYKRGQRFKKLYTTLSNDTVQRPVEDYRSKALILAALTACISLGAFVTLYILLTQKSAMVEDLKFIGKAGIRSSQVATYARTINLIYSNMTVPNLRLASSPEDLFYVKQLFREFLDEFSELHSGSYLGFHAPRRLPVDNGLRSLWEDAIFPVTEIAIIQFNQSLGNFTTMKSVKTTMNISLWDAGNQFIQKAASFHQNCDSYNLSLNGSVMEFDKNADLQWLVLNAPQAVFPGYLKTLDAYVMLLLASIKSVNQVQLILLVLEGVVACAIITGWMYLLLKKVADQRYKIYHIFMIVPTSLIRRLATKQYLLGDEAQEEVQEAVDAARAAPSGLVNSKAAGKQQEEGPQGKPVKAGKVNLHIKTTTTEATQAKPTKTLWSKLVAVLRKVLGIKPLEQAVETKRKLIPCFRHIGWLLWPFILWGFLVILGNILGFLLLNEVEAPVAMFNMVNYVNLLYNRNNFFLQELTFEQDPSKMNGHREGSAQRISELAKEYAVMLYGSEVVPNETSPHYQLVTSGVAHTGSDGANILFETTDCLCLNQTECLPPDNHLYTDTRQGLNRIMIKYIEIGRYIEKFQFLDPYLNGPEYDYYWNTRPDIAGGMERLTTAYELFVSRNVGNVLMLQVVVFVFSLLIVLGFVVFMLRPFIKVTRYETRRIAELLSQLPAEVDVPSMVQQVLLARNSQDPAAAPT